MSRPSYVRRPTEDAALARIQRVGLNPYVLPATPAQLHTRLQRAVEASDRAGAYLLTAAIARAA